MRKVCEDGGEKNYCGTCGGLSRLIQCNGGWVSACGGCDKYRADWKWYQENFDNLPHVHMGIITNCRIPTSEETSLT